jgi:hypothetical protein
MLTQQRHHAAKVRTLLFREQEGRGDKKEAKVDFEVKRGLKLMLVMTDGFTIQICTQLM